MICSACRAALRTQRRLALRSTTVCRSTAAASSPSSLSNAIRPRHPSAPTLLHRPFSASSFQSSQSPADAAIASEAPSMSAAESAIADLLSSALSPTELLVQDISGGCGSMYAIDITSPAFKGQSILKQQRMVNAALGDVMKGWHGVQIRTKVPEDA